ncbi:hypothetical protein BaRGS_00029393 [Batillaria attramentaria]|uniref:Uncharacterized protein n=1 Tax=Batillaria attramentaria TaxID=370345 RepID=A0ABD0JW59_9CAEN
MLPPATSSPLSAPWNPKSQWPPIQGALLTCPAYRVLSRYLSWPKSTGKLQSRSINGASSIIYCSTLLPQSRWKPPPSQDHTQLSHVNDECPEVDPPQSSERGKSR